MSYLSMALIVMASFVIGAFAIGAGLGYLWGRCEDVGPGDPPLINRSDE